MLLYTIKLNILILINFVIIYVKIQIKKIILSVIIFKIMDINHIIFYFHVLNNLLRVNKELKLNLNNIFFNFFNLSKTRLTLYL